MAVISEKRMKGKKDPENRGAVMGDERHDYSKIEEEYLDHLIKLAFDLDDLEKEQQILEEAGRNPSVPDEETLRRIWRTVQEKMDRHPE